MPAIRECQSCGAKSAKSPEESGIIYGPEALIIRLNYFEVHDGVGKRPSQLRFKYGLWLDLSQFQTPDYRRKRKTLRYRLSSVLFHAGKIDRTGHFLGIHTSPLGIRAVNDHQINAASVRDMLMTEVDQEAALRLWNMGPKECILPEDNTCQPGVCTYTKFW